MNHDDYIRYLNEFAALLDDTDGIVERLRTIDDRIRRVVSLVGDIVIPAHALSRSVTEAWASIGQAMGIRGEVERVREILGGPLRTDFTVGTVVTSLVDLNYKGVRTYGVIDSYDTSSVFAVPAGTEYVVVDRIGNDYVILLNDGVDYAVREPLRNDETVMVSPLQLNVFFKPVRHDSSPYYRLDLSLNGINHNAVSKIQLVMIYTLGDEGVIREHDPFLASGRFVIGGDDSVSTIGYVYFDTVIPLDEIVRVVLKVDDDLIGYTRVVNRLYRYDPKVSNPGNGILSGRSRDRTLNVLDLVTLGPVTSDLR